MNITLTQSELIFLRKLLEPHLVYYGTLAQSAKCSADSSAMWQKVNALANKLSQPSATIK